jgi:hypothetical protein
MSGHTLGVDLKKPVLGYLIPNRFAERFYCRLYKVLDQIRWQVCDTGEHMSGGRFQVREDTSIRRVFNGFHVLGQ